MSRSTPHHVVPAARAVAPPHATVRHPARRTTAVVTRTTRL